MTDLEKELQEAYDCLGRVLTLKVSINGIPVTHSENQSWQIDEARAFLESKGKLEDYIPK